MKMLKSSLPRAISIDCEMVGCGDKGQISVLGRIAVVNDRMELLMDAFVRPNQRVTNFRTKWSGLTWNILKNGEPFEIIRNRFLQIVEHYKNTSNNGLVFVGHDVSNDFKVINWSPPDSDIRDTSTYIPLRKLLVKTLLERGEIDPTQKDSFLKQKSSLKTFSKFLLDKNIQQGSHCPREDAKSAMMLYLKVRDRWESSISDKRSASDVLFGRDTSGDESRIGVNGRGDAKSENGNRSTSFQNINRSNAEDLVINTEKVNNSNSSSGKNSVKSSSSDKRVFSRKNLFRKYKRIKKGHNALEWAAKA